MEYRMFYVWMLTITAVYLKTQLAAAAPRHPGQVQVLLLQSLETTPQNVAVLVGDTVTLSCSVSPELPTYRLQWWEYASMANGNLISDNDYLAQHPQRDRYTLIRDSPNQYDLRISDVQLLDGGRYRCSESIQQPVTNAFAELIVLDSVESCITTVGASGEVMENQYITSECRQNYQGNIAPTITWVVPQPFNGYGSSTPVTVWSGIALNVSRTIDSQNIKATTSFVGSILPEDPGSAGNTPNYQHQYNSVTFTVYWGPQNIFIDPMKAVYQVDDMITCFASSKPASSFAMRNMRTGLVNDGAFFPVDATLAGTTQTVRCTAQNTIFNQPYIAQLDFEVRVA